MISVKRFDRILCRSFSPLVLTGGLIVVLHGATRWSPVLLEEQRAEQRAACTSGSSLDEAAGDLVWFQNYSRLQTDCNKDKVGQLWQSDTRAVNGPL